MAISAFRSSAAQAEQSAPAQIRTPEIDRTEPRVNIQDIARSTTNLICGTHGLPKRTWHRVLYGVAEYRAVDIFYRLEKENQLCPQQLLRRTQPAVTASGADISMPKHVPQLVFSGLSLIRELHKAEFTASEHDHSQSASFRAGLLDNFSIMMLAFGFGAIDTYPNPFHNSTVNSIGRVFGAQNPSKRMWFKPSTIRAYLRRMHEEEVIPSIQNYSQLIASNFMRGPPPKLDLAKSAELVAEVRYALDSRKVPHYRKKLRFWDSLTNSMSIVNDCD